MTDHACSNSQTTHPLERASSSPSPPSISAFNVDTAKDKSQSEPNEF